MKLEGKKNQLIFFVLGLVFVSLTLILFLLNRTWFVERIFPPRQQTTNFYVTDPIEKEKGLAYWVWITPTKIDQIDNKSFVSGYLGTKKTIPVRIALGNTESSIGYGISNKESLNEESPLYHKNWSIAKVSEVDNLIVINSLLIARIFISIPEKPNDCANDCQDLFSDLENYLQNNIKLYSDINGLDKSTEITIGPAMQILISDPRHE